MIARILICLTFFASIAQAAQTPSSEQMVDTLRSIYQITEAELADFDLELESPGFRSLTESTSYQRLLKLRILREQMVHRLFEQIKVTGLYTKFIAELEQGDPVDHMLAHDLLLLFSEAGFFVPSQKFNPGEIEASYLMVKPNLVLSGQIIRTWRKYKTLMASVKSPVALAQKTLAGKIQPSTSPTGNITGSEFPKNTWALTFDDGPHRQRTIENLNQLQAFGVRATFFWLAQNLAPNKTVVQTVKAAGMPLENHSYTHMQLSKANAQKLDLEIEVSKQYQTNFYGQAPHFFRCPYGDGVHNTTIRAKIANSDMVHVYWNVDSMDWHDRSPQSIYTRVKKQMAKLPGGIILMHDIQLPTPHAVRLLLQNAKQSQGTRDEIRWVTIPEIVQELNQKF